MVENICDLTKFSLAFGQGRNSGLKSGGTNQKENEVSLGHETRGEETAWKR